MSSSSATRTRGPVRPRAQGGFPLNEIPTTVAAALVLVFAVLPGFIGDRVHAFFVGSDWREREWRTLLRIIAFSFTGALLYTLFAAAVDLEPPLHLFPSTFQSLTPELPALVQLSVASVGHVLGSVIAAVLLVGLVKVLTRFSSRSLYPGAWDDFARLYAPKHWVVVGLTNGQVYAGKLKSSDVAVAMEDRDLVLEEPCAYNAKSKQYIAVSYQYLFVPAATWFSIAVISDPKDNRTVPVDEPLFTEQGKQKRIE